MAFVNFKKGLVASLPATYAEGTFYVTTDERAIYLDVSDSKRIRLGDFQEFSTLEALRANVNPSTSALYYVSDPNVLCKWNGTEYVQINRDTGATSVEVVGDGNAVTSAVYDPTTRKITLTMGETFATAAQLGAQKTELTELINEKTAGVAYESEVNDLSNRMTTAEGEIDALQAAIGEGGSVQEKIDASIEALKLGETYEPIGKGAEEAGKVQDALDEYIEANNAAVKKVSDDLAAEIKRAGEAEAANKGLAEAAQGAADKAQGDVDALADKVGEVPADKTVVQMIADAQSAATYDDTKVKEDIAANASAIEALEGVHAADKAELQGNIDKKADQTALDGVAGRVTTVEGKVATLEADAETVGSVDYKIAQAVAAIMENPDETMNSINELVIWVNDHAADALELSNQVTTNKNNIAALAELVGELPEGAVSTDIVGYIGEAIAAIGIGDYAKAADLTSAVGRIAALETKVGDKAVGVQIDEKIAALDLANTYDEKGAAAAVDGKLTTEVARAKAAEEANAAAAKAADDKAAAAQGEVDALELVVAGVQEDVADHEERIAAVEGKAHEHENKTVLDGITAEKVAAWDAAEGNAKAHATELNTAMNTRVAALEGINHDAYIAADEVVLAAAKEFTTQSLQWGEF